MKKLLSGIIFLYLLFAALVSYSAPDKLDSLQKLLKKAGTPTRKIELLCSLAEEQAKTDRQKAIELLTDAIKTSELSGDIKSEITVSNKLAKLFLGVDLERSYQLSRRAIELSHKTSQKAEEAEALKNIAAFYFMKKSYDNAIEYYSKSQQLKEQLGDKKGSADLLYNIAYMYSWMGNFDKTISYYLKALEVYTKINDKKECADLLVKIGNAYFTRSDFETSLTYYDKSLTIANELKDTMLVGNAYQMMGVVSHESGRYDKAFDYYKKSQSHFEKIKFKQGIANNFINIGLVYKSLNKIKILKNEKTWMYNNQKSLEYFQNAYLLMKELGKEKDIMNAIQSIGSVYLDAGEFNKAMAYFDTALTSARASGDKIATAGLLHEISYCDMKLKNNKRAEKNLTEAISIASELGVKSQLAQFYTTLGKLYQSTGRNEDALKYFKHSLDIIKEINAREYLGEVYLGLANVNESIGNYKMALDNFRNFSYLKDTIVNEQTVQLITEVETKYKTEKKEKEIKLLNASNELKENQIKQQRLILWVFVLIFILIVVFSILLYRQFNQKKKANLVLAYQKAEIQKQAQLLEAQNKELEKLSIVASKTENAVIIADHFGNIEWINEGFTRLYGYTLDDYKIHRGTNLAQSSDRADFELLLQKSISDKKSIDYISCSKKRNGNILWIQTTLTPIFDSSGNCFKIIAIDSDITSVKLAEQEVEKQRDIALKQRDLITEQKQEITDSINYARQIQRAVLPSLEILSGMVTDNFVIFKPRDIVSGDFYWAHKKDNRSIIVAADCTGHGVPGAFMSMLGIAYLNEITSKLFEQTKKSFTASEILNRLREMVISSLHQTGKLGESKDGMDMALCIIDHDTKFMQFAGANNPMYIIRNGELSITRGDKMPIGIHMRNDDFTNHTFSIEKNDSIYLFSDGIADQFGGEKQKKFKYKSFQELLLGIQEHPMELQKEIIELKFEEWRGDMYQVDDIVVIGLKI